MPFLFVALLAIAVFAVSFVVWLFCFLAIAYSGGHQNVSNSVFEVMPKAGWTAVSSFAIALLSGVAMFLSLRDYS